jgi:tetratricopeptide (TPR) repeat protein
MKLRKIIFHLLISLSAICFVLTSHSQENSTSAQDFASVFQTAVANYRAAKYEEALAAFNKALELNPRNVQVLTNLGLTKYQLGKKAEAIALLRKARSLDPSFSTPQASLAFILPQLDVKEIPHEIQLWETIRNDLLVPISLNAYLSLTALCFFAFGWLGISFFSQRKKALRDEQNPPAFPLILILIAFIFIGSASLTAMKVFDSQIPRATVIAEKATVFSAPTDQAVALYDIFAGLEVIIHQVNDQWIQVTYPGASTGWVQKNQVYQTAGRDLP